MHSSRMRTCCPYLPACTAGGLLWGVCSWGRLSAPRGACSRGVSASGPEGCVSQHAMGQTPPVDRQTSVKTYPSQTSFAGGNNYRIISWRLPVVVILPWEILDPSLCSIIENALLITEYF